SSLKQNDIPARASKAVEDVLGQLSRPSFRLVVAYMIEQLGLIEEKSLIKAVIRARNSLVHTGQFLSAKEPATAKELGFTDVGHEFFTLLSLVDRILLRIFGYVGMHVSYGTCTQQSFSPVIKELAVRRP